MPRTKDVKVEEASSQDNEATNPDTTEMNKETIIDSTAEALKNPVYETPESSRSQGPTTDTYSNKPTRGKGVLEMMNEGYGFLRANGVTPGNGDIYISQSQLRRFDIRPGDEVEGEVRPPKETERYFGMLKVEKVNGLPVDQAMKRKKIETLTAIYPDHQIKLETGKTPLATRMIDLLSPVGFGQRGMVVSPPKTGKTTILKDIAHGIAENYPEVHLMAVLIGERPEEVTDISRSVKGEVFASNFDEPPEAQTRVAEMALERAKRLVETDKDVVILLDSMTRLGRAYNLALPPSGRTLSGGFDPIALYPPKKFFGAARNFENGGSLTILATALVDTGSRMDDLIYEEFKGTGNMELHLDRSLAERRIFPAIDVSRSGTRNEDKLFSEDRLAKVWRLRRMLESLNELERTELLVDRMAKSGSNDEFLDALHKSD